MSDQRDARRETGRRQADAERVEVARAVLRATSDLMFVMRRDGTYVDCYAHDGTQLFAPPEAIIGRTVRDILPPALAEMIMTALDRACRTDEPVLVEYELPMGEPRWYEARIVQAGADRLLSIVRDVTEARRATALNRELARRLIASQENERQRLARELHDDFSQRLALLNIDIDHLATLVADESVRARIRELSLNVGEIAGDVHQLSYELHPSKLQMLGLVAAVQSLCRETSNHGALVVSFAHHAIPGVVDPNIALCLYRIVQESLHNAARHSHAQAAEVSMAREGQEILLQIADGGVGFDPVRAPHRGLGLVSMQERVAALKGYLAIDATPGSGTRISVRIPLGPEALPAAPPVIAT